MALDQEIKPELDAAINEVVRVLAEREGGLSSGEILAATQRMRQIAEEQKGLLFVAPPEVLANIAQQKPADLRQVVAFVPRLRGQVVAELKKIKGQRTRDRIKYYAVKAFKSLMDK